MIRSVFIAASCAVSANECDGGDVGHVRVGIVVLVLHAYAAMNEPMFTSACQIM